ncbi:binding-protein-dependent transport systems inner membrane component [Tolumonas auensis DSM 9187]|uniref:Binding-protein-dependent transport systems inner membrane component n=1 Tax=Tolumonas auensis (strain DSM 9187 / NBRC 110442 / TA 4) TaxID=595494 RepID=C4LCI8_TOLAT|nr:ABC transporter permease subunit [Tolumonas auensis]ACQ94492.1 binding-protein-dependent transport systems inner membrane component [Tolumonas auensis DSM 9187]
MARLINRQPDRLGRWLLALLPFVIVLVLYLLNSEARLAVNPNDKLLPSFPAIFDSIAKMAFEPSRRTGEYLLWADTLSSLRLLLMGVGISALLGLSVGLLNGGIPLIRIPFSPLVTTVSLIPPMAILPILFIVFGLGDLAKVMLIVIGICPILIRDLQLKTLSLPEEQLIKAQTLGATSWQILLRMMLPQVLPRLFEAVRLTLGSAWLFLIAAEAIAATQGLGYRIFLVRRYLDMSVILPYVVWITLLAFAMDWLLKVTARKAFPWYFGRNGEAQG